MIVISILMPTELSIYEQTNQEQTPILFLRAISLTAVVRTHVQWSDDGRSELTNKAFVCLSTRFT